MQSRGQLPPITARGGDNRRGNGKRAGVVNANFWLIQTFNGISYGALLFPVGRGLSPIFGDMRARKKAYA